LNRLAIVIVLGSLFAPVSVASNAHAQVLTGLVFHDGTREPIYGAEIRVLTVDLEPVEVAESDRLGGFEVLLREPGTYFVSISAEGFIGRLSDEVEVGTATYELVLPLVPVDQVGGRAVAEAVSESDDPETAEIVGRVVEYESGEALEGVEVALSEWDRVVVSGAGGFFSMADVPQGLYEIRFSMLGFGEQTAALLVEAGKGYRVDAELSVEAIEIEGVTVTLEPQEYTGMLANAEFRMNHNQHLGGIFLTRSDFEVRGNPPLSEMLRGFSSVRLRKYYGGEYEVFFRRCANPLFFVDGVKISGRDELMPLDMLSGIEVEIVEIYRGPASLPPEFGGSDAQCGAVVVWTRRGGR